MKRSNFIYSSLLMLVLFSSVGTALAQTTDAENDPIADLQDLYAFVDPHCAAQGGTGCEADPIELILALTLNPNANGGDQFSADVVYHFNIENDTGQDSQINCAFSAGQIMSCKGTDGLAGLAAQANVGQTGNSGDLRVYAGLRDNPTWFDLEAFEDFQTMGIAAYTDPGVDSLAGTNVLAIVVGIKITAIPGGDANHDVLKIWAVSERVAGDGLNGSFSGAWYNPDQDGQGWALEFVGDPSAPVLVSYFYGHDNDGEQLWLLGAGPDIDGTTATVDVFRQDGTGFGGDFDPTSTDRPVVGTMKFEFDTCRSGSVMFTSDDPDLADFVTPIKRLTSISTLDCSLLTAGQVDRVGRPLAAGFIPDEMRNDYNTNDDPTSWDDDYNATFLAALNTFATADGDPAWNGFYSAQEWADVFPDDRVQIDIKKAQSVDFMTIERSKIEGLDYNESSGRALDYDIHENLFNVLITSFDPFVDDFVDGNDVPFRVTFPFLAPPH